MIKVRGTQLSFGDGLIAGEVSDLREDWMKHADAVLADTRALVNVACLATRTHPIRIVSDGRCIYR